MKTLISITLTILTAVTIFTVTSNAATANAATDYNWISSGDIYNKNNRTYKGCSLYGGTDENGGYRCITVKGKSDREWYPSVAAVPTVYDLPLNDTETDISADDQMVFGNNNMINGYVSVAWVSMFGVRPSPSIANDLIPEKLQNTGYNISGSTVPAGIAGAIDERFSSALSVTLLPDYGGGDKGTAKISHVQIFYKHFTYSKVINIDLREKIDLSKGCKVKFRMNGDNDCFIYLNDIPINPLKNDIADENRIHIKNPGANGFIAVSAMSAPESVCNITVKSVNGYSAKIFGTPVYYACKAIGETPDAGMAQPSTFRYYKNAIGKYELLTEDEKLLVPEDLKNKIDAVIKRLTTDYVAGNVHVNEEKKPRSFDSVIFDFLSGKIYRLELLSGAEIKDKLYLDSDQTVLFDSGSICSAPLIPEEGARIEIGENALVSGFDQPGNYVFRNGKWKRFNPEFFLKGATILMPGGSNNLALPVQSLKFGMYLYKNDMSYCISDYGMIFIPAIAAPGETEETITLDTPLVAAAHSCCAPVFGSKPYVCFTASLDSIPNKRFDTDFYARGFITYRIADSEITVYQNGGIVRSVSTVWNNIIYKDPYSGYDTETGPVVENIMYDGSGTVMLTYTDFGSGLVNPGNELTGFYIKTAKPYSDWRPAHAEISGINTVAITSDKGVITDIQYRDGNMIANFTFKKAVNFTYSIVDDDNYASGITLSPYFKSGMILQHGKAGKIYGYAPESENGRIVVVEINGKRYTAKVADGKWCAVYDPTEASKSPVTVKVYGKYTTLVCENVLFGKVYMLAGSENVDQTIAQYGINDDVDLEGYENVRLACISSKDMDRTGSISKNASIEWLSPETADADSSSALGYLLSCTLYDRLKGVPTGVVAVRGARLSDRLIGDILRDGSFEAVIWCPGEKDSTSITTSADGTGFADEIASEFENWRLILGESDIPFYLTELTPLDDKDPVCGGYGALRAEIGSVPSKLERSYLIPTSDLPSAKAGLYVYKAELAERISAVVSGKECVTCFESCSVSGYTASLIFSNTVTCSDPENIRGFEVYSLGSWKTARASIRAENSVEVYFEDSYTGIRYNGSDHGRCPESASLRSSNGIPVPAFSVFPERRKPSAGHLKVTASPGWDIYKTVEANNDQTIQNYSYRYGPTMIANDDGTVDAWYSSTGISGLGVLDYFTHNRLTPSDTGMTVGEETVVLAPTPLTMDRYSVCDPDIIYFGGYYYIGYTSTLHKNGYVNSIFIARSKNLAGPYEKWNGSGWGGTEVKPIIYFDGEGDNWGFGEPALIELDGTIYIYYSEKTFDKTAGKNTQMTRVAVADATDENWPAKITQMGVALDWMPGYSGVDFAYDESTGMFLGITTQNKGVDDDGNEIENKVVIFESPDGLRYNEVHYLKTNIVTYCSNIGMSSSKNGHLVKGRQNYIAYAYINNDKEFGRWSTYMQPITVEHTRYLDRSGDNGATVKPDEYNFDVKEKEPDKMLGITVFDYDADRAYYLCDPNGSVTVDVYPLSYGLNYKKGNADLVTPLPKSDIILTDYDTDIIRVDGTRITGLRVGKTLVTAHYEAYICTFPVIVTDIPDHNSNFNAAEWFCPVDEYTVSMTSKEHTKAIRGVIRTGNGIYGEAFNSYKANDLFNSAGEGPNGNLVTYSVGDRSVCTVNMYGLIEPKRPGTTYVTATLHGMSFTVRVTVTE